MGILSGSTSILQYRLEGEYPEDLLSWVAEQLQKHAFVPIDQAGEERSIGWTCIDNPDKQDFSNVNDWERSPYLCFSLRIDQRKVPPSVLRRHLEKACDKFLSEHPGLKRVPKAKKEELKEQLRGALLAQTFPTSQSVDVIWKVEEKTLYFTSLSSKIAESFEGLFRTTFEGLRPILRTPFDLAKSLIPSELTPRLDDLNLASGDAVLEQIKGNSWLGQDFLLWLLHQTLESDSRYRVAAPGPKEQDTQFVAFLNDRLALAGSTEGGRQRVALSGPQSKFHEAKTALCDGKNFSAATLHLEEEESLWKLCLKADTFHLSGIKCPNIKLDKGEDVDQENERHAFFLERMSLIESALQFFASLYLHFLTQRLDSDAWSQNTLQLIHAWLHQTQEAA